MTVERIKNWVPLMEESTESLADWARRHHEDHVDESTARIRDFSEHTSVTDMDDLDNTTLSDPNADRIVFWDDSDGAYEWLIPGNSVAITTNTLDTIQDIRTTASPTFDDITAGHLGLGGASPVATRGIDYDEVMTDTDNSTKYGGRFNLEVAKTASEMTVLAHGLYMAIALDSSNTQNWTASPVALQGFQGRVEVEAGSTGTVTGAASLYTDASIADAATVTNYYGMYVQTPTVAGTPKKVTNDYGIYIADQDQGATLNYAVYTGSGLVRLGGALTLATCAAAGTDTDKFLVLDSSGRVDYRTGANLADDIEGDIDHGSIAGLAGDDHTQYLLANGSRGLSGDWNAGAHEIIAGGPWVDVRAYGATGDGVTDDTAAIAAAIASITSGTIFFPAGTYMTDEVHYKSDIMLIGASRDATTLKLNDSQDTPVFNRVDGIMGTGIWASVNALPIIENVVIADMTIDGNHSGQTTADNTDTDALVYLQRISDSHVLRCEVKDGRAGGVWLRQAMNSSVTHCYIHNNLHGTCVKNELASQRDLTAGSADDEKGGCNVLAFNRVEMDTTVGNWTANVPITSLYTYGDLIIGNKVRTQSHYGIVGECCNTLQIIGNYVDGFTLGSGGGGINLNPTGEGANNPVPENCVIAGNQIRAPYWSSTSAGIRGVGIHVNGNDYATVQGNHIYLPTKNGSGPTWASIGVLSSAYVSIDNNKIVQIDSDAVGIAGIAFNTCESISITNNNPIETYQADGIVMGSTVGDNYKITGNNILQQSGSASSDGIDVQGSNGVVIGNTLSYFSVGIRFRDSGTLNSCFANYFPNTTTPIVEDTEGNAVLMYHPDNEVIASVDGASKLVDISGTANDGWLRVRVAGETKYVALYNEKAS